MLHLPNSLAQRVLSFCSVKVLLKCRPVSSSFTNISNSILGSLSIIDELQEGLAISKLVHFCPYFTDLTRIAIVFTSTSIDLTHLLSHFTCVSTIIIYRNDPNINVSSPCPITIHLRTLSHPSLIIPYPLSFITDSSPFVTFAELLVNIHLDSMLLSNICPNHLVKVVYLDVSGSMCGPSVEAFEIVKRKFFKLNVVYLSDPIYLETNISTQVALLNDFSFNGILNSNDFSTEIVQHATHQSLSQIDCVQSRFIKSLLLYDVDFAKVEFNVPKLRFLHVESTAQDSSIIRFNKNYSVTCNVFPQLTYLSVKGNPNIFSLIPIICPNLRFLSFISTDETLILESIEFSLAFLKKLQKFFLFLQEIPSEVSINDLTEVLNYVKDHHSTLDTITIELLD
ncbi:hypothetical protein P9112_007406 [Eukaryota sp. TZLM1-RC]